MGKNIYSSWSCFTHLKQEDKWEKLMENKRKNLIFSLTLVCFNLQWLCVRRYKEMVSLKSKEPLAVGAWVLDYKIFCSSILTWPWCYRKSQGVTEHIMIHLYQPQSHTQPNINVICSPCACVFLRWGSSVCMFALLCGFLCPCLRRLLFLSVSWRKAGALGCDSVVHTDHNPRKPSTNGWLLDRWQTVSGQWSMWP